MWTKWSCHIFRYLLGSASAYYLNTFLNYSYCVIHHHLFLSICFCARSAYVYTFTAFITSPLLLHPKKLGSSKFVSFVNSFEAILFHSWKLLCQECRIPEHGCWNFNKVSWILTLCPLLRGVPTGDTLMFHLWAVPCCLHLPLQRSLSG